MQPAPIPGEHSVERCALARVPGLDAATLLRSLQQVGSWTALLKQSAPELKALGWSRKAARVWSARASSNHARAQAEADARAAFVIGEGTTEIQHLLIASQLLRPRS